MREGKQKNPQPYFEYGEEFFCAADNAVRSI